MFKKIITSTVAATLLFPAAVLAQSAPNVAYRPVDTPYGQFGCLIRAENKLYSIGATTIQKTSASIFGIINGVRIAVWCRGQEAVIFTSGPGSVSEIRDEIYNAF